jgi:hypothetical protein
MGDSVATTTRTAGMTNLAITFLLILLIVILLILPLIIITGDLSAPKQSTTNTSHPHSDNGGHVLLLQDHIGQLGCVDLGRTQEQLCSVSTRRRAPM